MARIKEEDLRLNIIVNGDKGRSEMLSINKTIAETVVNCLRFLYL